MANELWVKHLNQQIIKYKLVREDALFSFIRTEVNMLLNQLCIDVINAGAMQEDMDGLDGLCVHPKFECSA